MAKKKRDISKLLERAGAPHNFGPRCFAAKLGVEAREFVDAVQGSQGDGNFVNMKETSLILEEEFGVSVSESTVRKHIRRDCKCSRFQRG